MLHESSEPCVPRDTESSRRVPLWKSPELPNTNMRRQFWLAIRVLLLSTSSVVAAEASRAGGPAESVHHGDLWCDVPDLAETSSSCDSHLHSPAPDVGSSPQTRRPQVRDQDIAAGRGESPLAMGCRRAFTVVNPICLQGRVFHIGTSSASLNAAFRKTGTISWWGLLTQVVDHRACKDMHTQRRRRQPCCMLAAILTILVSRLSVTGHNFTYVPVDGDFGANRTLPGFYALGDISLLVRPAGVEKTVLPALPVLAPFPSWTTLSTRTGSLGIVTMMQASPGSCTLAACMHGVMSLQLEKLSSPVRQVCYACTSR